MTEAKPPLTRNYYVQTGTPDNIEGEQSPRVFMDTRMHKGCKLVRKIVAVDWRTARTEVPT